MIVIREKEESTKKNRKLKEKKNRKLKEKKNRKPTCRNQIYDINKRMTNGSIEEEQESDTRTKILIQRDPTQENKKKQKRERERERGWRVTVDEFSTLNVTPLQA